MDEFKKYIQQHRSSLDLDEPGNGVWEAIRRETRPAQAPVKHVPMVKWAVAACIILLAGLGGWYLVGENTTRQMAAVTPKSMQKPIAPQPATITPTTKQKEENIASLKPETLTGSKPVNKKKQRQPGAENNHPVNNPAVLALLQNVENSFTQVINLQKDRVSSMPMYAESADYFNDFKLQFRQIEKDEKSIKSDIVKRGLTDALLDQLINLYQQKLGILKQLQTEMTKTNNRYRQNRGPVDTTRSYFLNL